MDSSTLQIVIAAQDEISAVLQGINDQIKEMSGVVDDASGDIDDAFATVKGSLTELSEGFVAATDVSEASMAKLGATTKETSGVIDESTASVKASSGGLLGMNTGAVVAAAGIAYLSDKTIKAAVDFQSLTETLVTGAGESQANLKMVQQGIMSLADSTGTSTTDLTNGMYLIESAGFHAASGLTVLKAAAEGAKIGNADLSTVADALTTVLVNYHLTASSATAVTNEMVTAVAQGKMHMQDFAASLSTVLPIAHEVGLSFAQVAGAEATLTAGGVSAQQASQDLHAVISTLQAPTQAQTKYMENLGINAVQLSQNMGKDGLTGTLQTLTDAIAKNMGPAGLVIENTMQSAKVATQDFAQEVAGAPAPVQKLAQELEDGTISFKDFRTAVQSLPEGMTNLGKQMEATYNQANSFNSLLTSGSPAAQTYAASLKQLTGQTNSMNAVMMLTGAGSLTFANNVKKIGDSAKTTSSNVMDWNDVQNTAKEQMDEFKESIETAGIAIGSSLLPALTAAAKGLAAILKPIAELVESHKDLFAAVTLLVGGLLSLITVTALAQKGASMLSGGYKTLDQTLMKVTNSVKALFMNQAALDAENDTGVSKLGDLRGALQGVGSDAEAAAGEVGAAGGTEGLLGSVASINPVVGLAVAGVAAGTYEMVTHWSTVKSTVDSAVSSVKNFLGLGGNTNVGVNVKAPTAAQSQATVTGDAKSIIADQQTEAALMKAQPAIDAAAAKAKDTLAKAQATYNNALNAWYTAAAKYGPESSKAQSADNALNKAKEALTKAQQNNTKAQDTERTSTAKLTATQQAQIKSIDGIKKALDIVPNAQKQVKDAQDALSNSTNTLQGKYQIYSQALANSKKAGGDNILTQNILKEAQNQLNSAIEDAEKKTNTYKSAVDNEKTALSTVNSWTANQDKAIKSLGLSHSVAQAYIKILNDQVKNSSKSLQKAKSDADNHTTSIQKIGSAADTVTPKINALNTALSKTNSTASAGLISQIKAIPGLQTGVSNFAGGTALVGEAGPELVNLPTGSSVTPAPQTASLLSAAANNGGNGGYTININAGAMMGTPQEAQQFATIIYQQLQRIARQHGSAGALPNIGILPS